VSPSTWRAFSPDARRFLCGAVLLELGHAFLWVLQNLYVRSIGYGESEAGLVLASAGLGVVITTLPAAALYDRLGARSSLLISCVGASLSLVGLACATSLPWLCVFAALQGAMFTQHRVVSAPFLVSASRPAERTHLFSAEMATHSVASMVGLSMAGFIAGRLQADWLGETEALRVTLLLGALGTLGSLLFYRLIQLDTRNATDTASTDERLPPVTVPPRRRRMFAILAPKHWNLWWRLALPHGLVGVGAGLTIPFINLYFTDRFQTPKSELGLVMSASQFTMTFGLFAIPWCVARLGLLRSTILSEALSLPFFLTLAFTLNFPVAILAFVFRSALMNLSHPMWRNLMMEITPGEWRAAVNGVTMLAWHLGWALSNQLGGELIERSHGWLGPDVDGYAVPMLITTAVYLAAIVLELVFFWDVRHLGQVKRPGPELSET
jgi:MFS family permease